MSTDLSDSELAWCSFMDEWKAKGLTQEPTPLHAFEQGFSTGQKMEHDRVKRKLEEERDGTGVDWSDVDQVQAFIDRIV